MDSSEKSPPSPSSSSSRSSSSSSSVHSAKKINKEKKVKRESKHTHKKKKDKKEKKDKKHKKEKKEKKERRKKKHKRGRDDETDDSVEEKSSHKKHKTSTLKIDQNVYGMYGIIREENLHSKQQEFDAYMAEVKGISGVMSQPRRDIMNYFRGFMEDYNTATMPHEKFYNFERWEMDEYRRASQNRELGLMADGREREGFNDEAERAVELKRLRLMQEVQQFDALKSQLQQQQGLRGDMRRQETLRAELQLAFKQGDAASVKRLERLLAPEEAAVAVKHPWAS